MGFFIVFIGAGIGGMARHGINLAAFRLLGAGGFPAGTLLINVAGSFLMGLVIEIFAQESGLSPSLRLFLTTGILGGFTTFSAFSAETVFLIESGQTGYAALYVLLSVLLSVGALFLALMLMRAMLA